MGAGGCRGAHTGNWSDYVRKRKEEDQFAAPRSPDKERLQALGKKLKFTSRSSMSSRLLTEIAALEEELGRRPPPGWNAAALRGSSRN